MTSSLDWVMAPTVAMTVVVVATGTAKVPDWSSGAAVATPSHSEIWALPPMVAGFMVNVVLTPRSSAVLSTQVTCGRNLPTVRGDMVPQTTA